jgi:hypothetical protein
LGLEARGQARTVDETRRHRELGEQFGFDGATLTPEKVDEFEEKNANGETLSMGDAIAYDAALRRGRALNRRDRRELEGRALRDRVFRRPVVRPSVRRAATTGRARPRGRTSRCRARAPASDPDEPDPPLGGPLVLTGAIR